MSIFAIGKKGTLFFSVFVDGNTFVLSTRMFNETEEEKSCAIFSGLSARYNHFYSVFLRRDSLVTKVPRENHRENRDKS